MSFTKNEAVKIGQGDTDTFDNERLFFSDKLTHIPANEEIQTIKEGLLHDQKFLSSKYFYDDLGSELFEKICRLSEYYQTRTELAILKDKVVPGLSGYNNVELVELGSGENKKINILLDAFSKGQTDDIHYVPVDVSEAAIRKSSEELISNYPQLSVHAVLADFTKSMELHLNGYERIFCFFGSTIGNLPQKDAVRLLRNITTFMRRGDKLLVGFDRKKPIEILEAAYNDSMGVTAEFNKNILNVINKFTDGNFDPEQFEHVAFYNDSKSRIEMHLRALKNMEVYLKKADLTVSFSKGETVHTENSRKYEKSDFDTYAMKAGLKINEIYSDEKEWFSVVEFSVNR